VESILNSTKKILGIDESYLVFDLDITTHINAAFSTLNQLGVGPENGYFITDEEDQWSEFDVPDNQLHLAKTYIYLKVKSLFDPPATSYHTEAIKNQINELEWRLNMLREVALPEEVSP
jgi:hypothetical protein